VVYFKIQAERLECMEGSAFESHLESWSAQVASIYPDRKLPTVVATANGKTACITRFFKPFAPPGKIKSQYGGLKKTKTE
jgi:hypothetical protein